MERRRLSLLLCTIFYQDRNRFEILVVHCVTWYPCVHKIVQKVTTTDFDRSECSNHAINDSMNHVIISKTRLKSDSLLYLCKVQWCLPIWPSSSHNPRFLCTWEVARVWDWAWFGDVPGIRGQNMTVIRPGPMALDRCIWLSSGEVVPYTSWWRLKSSERV